MSYVFSPIHLNPPVLSKFLAEYHSSIQTSDSSCILLDGGSLASHILNMLEDIPCQCPIVRNVVRDFLVCWVFKGLPSLHLTFCLLRDVHCTDNGSIPQSGSGRVNLSVYNESLPAVLDGMGKLVCLRGFTKQCHICPNLAEFLVNLFRAGLACHPIGTYLSPISAFWNHILLVWLNIALSFLNK